MHLEAIRAGTGRGVLPCYVGDGHPLLERLTPPIPDEQAHYAPARWVQRQVEETKSRPNTGSSSTVICAALHACAR
jgi:hypothetical protein